MINRNPWNEFLQQVEVAQSDIKKPWFRGHSNSAWALLPSLLRAPGGFSREMEAFTEFRRSAVRLFDSRSSDWEMLFDMQHYGIPTRLLDWTESLGVAMAFILFDDYEPASDAAVYVLDPLALNKLSGVNEVKSLPGDGTFDYQNIYFDKEPFAPLLPIAVLPPMQSARLFAQQGTFTIHGDNAAPLEVQCPTAVRKLILPAAAKPAAWEFLQHAGLDEYHIYPDIVGMARHLRRKLFGF